MRAGIEATHGPMPEIEIRERLLRRLYDDELSPIVEGTAPPADA